MLNRPRLIEAYRDKFMTTQANATEVVDWVFAQITAELARGGEVSMRNFGALVRHRRPAGEGHNPRTGEKIKIPAKNVVRFKAGKELLRLVNGG